MKRYLNNLLYCLLLLGGCKGCDDDVQPKLDPSFKMGLAQAGGVFQEFDTTYQGSDVHFKANDSLADVYRWEIGEAPMQYKRTAGIYFPGNSLGHYKIKLTVRKNLGQDSLVDSSVRYLTVTSRVVHFPAIYGKYRGYNTEKPDSLFTIWICFWDFNSEKMDTSFTWSPPCCNQIYVVGFTNYPISVGMLYSNMWNESEGGHIQHFNGILTNRKDLTISYQRSVNGAPYISKTFRGIKIK